MLKSVSTGRNYQTLKSRIQLVLMTAVLCLGTSAMAMDCPIGWAAVNALGQNGTTGGGNGAVVHVTTYSAFVNYAGSATPCTIVIDSTSDSSWNVTNVVTVKGNKTIVGANGGV